MAQVRRVDFAKAKAENKILRGLVKECEVIESTDGQKKSQLTVIHNGKTVFISQEDVINFPYSKSITSLVGEEISFVVKDVFPDDIVFGDMKKAQEIKLKPTMDRLINGEVLEGMIVYALPHGVYVNIAGVQGLLKNHKFSNDGTAVTDVYPVGDFIKVKLDKISEKGVILLAPEKPITKKSKADKESVKRGQSYIGKITATYPDRLYVNIGAGLDCLCYPSKLIPNPQIGQTVKVFIKKTFYGNKDGRLYIRGEITRRADESSL